MSKRHLYWAFYKSTIAPDFGISLMFALIAPVMEIHVFGNVPPEPYPEAVCRYFAISVVSIGLIVTFSYKELARPLEYYFYYNQGISKIKLIICCLLVNIPAATLALILRHYVASA